MERNVEQCERSIGYTFSNKRHNAESLNMSGNPIYFEGQLVRIPKNTRLAVYGDSVAEALLCRKWVHTSLTKREWTKIRNDVLMNSVLAGVGFDMGLDKCINLNPGTRVVSQDMMATTVEAILGAVHLDGGDDALASVMAGLGLTSELLVTFTTLTSVL